MKIKKYMYIIIMTYEEEFFCFIRQTAIGAVHV